MIPGGLNSGRPAAILRANDSDSSSPVKIKVDSTPTYRELVEELIRHLSRLEKLDSIEAKLDRLLSERAVKKTLWARLTNVFKRFTNQ